VFRLALAGGMDWSAFPVAHLTLSNLVCLEEGGSMQGQCASV
jgi:hypothetical protein